MILPALMSQVALYASAPADQSVYQLGTVSLLDVPRADHDFVYTNTGHAQVVIDRLQPDCRCTSAVIASGTGETLPYTVAPGDSIKIRVSIDLGMEPSGPVARSVFVFVAGQTDPVATYTLKGDVEPDVHFSPSSLDFGAVSAGSSRTIRVLVSIDDRLIRGEFPKLVADYPGIEIAPVSNRYHGRARFKVPRVGHEIDRTFDVTIPDNIVLGRINTTLSLFVGSATIPAAASEFRNNTALISGVVTGSIKSDPEAVAFGTVSGGQTDDQTVTLTGNSAADVEGITVQSDNTFLDTALTKPDKNPSNVRTLTLTVKKSSPSGLFNSKVTVVLVDGQRLVIPVLGYVTSTVR